MNWMNREHTREEGEEARLMKRRTKGKAAATKCFQEPPRHCCFALLSKVLEIFQSFRFFFIRFEFLKTKNFDIYYKCIN